MYKLTSDFILTPKYSPSSISLLTTTKISSNYWIIKMFSHIKSKQYYKKSIKNKKYENIVYYIRNKDDDNNYLVYYSAKMCNFEMVKFFLRGMNNISYINALVGASAGGSMEITNYFIDCMGDSFGRCLFEASKKGHMNIINFLIERIMLDAFSSGRLNEYFNEILLGASQGGQCGIIDYAISKGTNNFSKAIWNAAMKKRKDIIEYLISKGANDFNYALCRASEEGIKDMIEYLISKGANDFNGALYNAAYGGHKDLVEYLISRGANDFDRALDAALAINHKDLIDYFISRGAVHRYRNDFLLRASTTRSNSYTFSN